MLGLGQDWNRLGCRLVVVARAALHGLWPFASVVRVREVLVGGANRTTLRHAAQRHQEGLVGGAAEGAAFHQPIHPPHTDKPNGAATVPRTPKWEIRRAGFHLRDGDLNCS